MIAWLSKEVFMKEEKQKMKLWKKLTIIISSAILTIVAVIGLTIYGIWHNEIATVMSIKEIRERNDEHLDGSVYEMNVSGGFYLEDFIKQGGVKSDSELISFITSNITKGLIPINMTPPEIGCASFTAGLEDGDKIFARNYDFSKTNTMIVRTNGGKNRYKTISVTDLQFLGIDPDKGINGMMDKITSIAAAYTPLDGINEMGLAVGIYMTYQGEKTVATNQNTAKPDITSTTMLRLMLDYAKNIDEAIEIAKYFDLHDSANTSYHYMVADASGRSAILEWVGESDILDNDGAKRELKVIYNDDDSNIGVREGKASFQWITNFIVLPDYYESDSKKPGLDRYDEIYNRLNESNGILGSENDAMEILKAVGRRSWNNDDNNGCTVHSVIYNLTERKMLFVSNENFNDPSAIFELGF